jgi:hypothetical protein
LASPVSTLRTSFAVSSGQGGVADALGDRLERIAVLRDRVLRPPVEPAFKPVFDRLPDGVSSRCMDVAGDVLAQGTELVADLGLGPAADGRPPAQALGEQGRGRSLLSGAWPTAWFGLVITG